MTSRDSRAEYERRMHRVLEHIDRHLDQALDLEALAGVALFSPFHFHRLFTALMGETVGDYLRRRRVEVAAWRLIAQPRLAVLDVALSVGFGSAEAFARAFKGRFDCTPSAWRARQARERNANGKMGQADRKNDQALQATLPNHEVSFHPSMETSMNVQLIDREPVSIAYLRHVGPYGQPILQFWQATVYPWLLENGLLDRPRYGISHDDPGITEAKHCRYDAGVEVPTQFVTSGNAMKTTLPGRAIRHDPLRGDGGADRRCVGRAAAGLAACQRPATRRATLLRALSEGFELRPEDRCLRLRDLHSSRSTLALHPGGFTCTAR